MLTARTYTGLRLGIGTESSARCAEMIHKGLHMCRKGNCLSCPYNDSLDDSERCIIRLLDDAEQYIIWLENKGIKKDDKKSLSEPQMEAGGQCIYL